MLETSMLISCTGKITRAELADLPTPPATATHIPIPHAAVVQSLVEMLGFDHGCAVAAQIVFITGDVRLRVRDRVNQPGGIVRQRGNVVQRIGDLRELASGVIGKVVALAAMGAPFI